MIMGLSLVVAVFVLLANLADGRRLRRRRPAGAVQLMATTTQSQPQALPGTATFVGRPVERPIVRTLRRFAKHRMAVIGVIVIAILVILAIVGNEAEALKQNLGQANKPPSPGALVRDRPERPRRLRPHPRRRSRVARGRPDRDGLLGPHRHDPRRHRRLLPAGGPDHHARRRHRHELPDDHPAADRGRPSWARASST